MATIIRSNDVSNPAENPGTPDDGMAIPGYEIGPALAPYVYRCEGFFEPGSVQIRRRELLLVGTPIILAFGSPYRLSAACDPSTPVRAIQHFVAGLHDTYSTSESTGPNWVIQIDLTPIGAFRILEMPLLELTNQIVSVADILGTVGRQLVSNLEATTGWNERFRLVESFLLDRLASSNPEASEMSWAWRQLTDAHGSILINTIAEELRWSQRLLIQRFREQIGMPPKLVARQLRFLHAIDLLKAGPDRSLATIGNEAGYFDQPHFVRDFSEFSGSTPAMYRRDQVASSRAAVSQANK